MTDAIALKLIVEDDSGKRTAISAKPDAQGELTIGRANDNGLRLDERNVSRHHAKLLQTGPALWEVVDLGAYNGVQVNGVRIQGKQAVAIGDVLRVGDFSLELRNPSELGPEITRPTLLIGNDEGTEPEGSARALARQIAEEVTTPGDAAPQGPTPRSSAATTPQPDAPASPGAHALVEEATAVMPRDEGPRPAAELMPPFAKLLCLVGDQAGVAFDICRAEMVIGRTKENDIAIDHRSMSRHHARVTVLDGRYRIVDLDSANGLLINDETYSDTDLKHGDVAELGHVRLRFVAPNEPAIMTADERGHASAPLPERRPKRHLAAPLTALAVVAAGIVGSYAYLARPPKGADAAHGGSDNATDNDQAAQLLSQARQAAASRQYPRAEALASAALALDPARSEARTIIAQCDAEQKGHAALEAGQSAVDRKDWATAYAALKDVPHGCTSAPRAQALLEQARPALVQMHVDAARRAVLADHLDEAEGHISALAALEPTSALLTELHQAYDEGQKRHQAGHDAPVAASSNSGDHHNGATGGSGHKDAGRDKRSSNNNDEPHQLYADGTRALSDGKYPKALDILNRCVALDKQFARCYRALGIAYAKTGNGPKAAKNYRLYLKTDPQAKDANTVRQLLQQYEASQEHLGEHDRSGDHAVDPAAP